MNLHIQHGRLIDPANDIDARMDLFISAGKVVARGQAPAGFVAERVLDASGKFVLPGLVDLAVCLPSPTGAARAHNANASRIESEMCAALSGGVTRMVCAPHGGQTPAQTQMKVHELGAMTVDLKGEVVAQMRSMHQAGCFAFTHADTPIYDTAIILSAMQYAKTFDYALWLRAQDPWLSRTGVMASGAYATRLGLAGIPVEAEVIALQTLLALQRSTGVRLHIRQLSCAESISLVRSAKKAGMPVTCDVDANHVHLTDVDIGFYDTNFRLDPPLRGQRDREAIRTALADGTIDGICSAHTMMSQQDKQGAFAQAQPGSTGLELLLSLTLKWAQDTRVPMLDAMARVTSGPGAVLAATSPGSVGAGQLGLGAAADLCILDPEDYWQVTQNALLSESKFTPFLGMELPGRVHVCLLDGRVVWEKST